MKGRDEKHKKGQNLLILRALKSNQASNEHCKDHVEKSNTTWANVVSGKGQGPSDQVLQYTRS